MIDGIMKNIEREIDILKEIASFSKRYPTSNFTEQRLLKEAENSLISQMRILNDALPEMIKNVDAMQKLPGQKNKIKETNLERIEYGSEGKRVVISKKDKEKFLKELHMSERTIKKIKFVPKIEEKEKGFQKSRVYVKFSNKIFENMSKKIIKNEMFRNLKDNLRKANINILGESYIAISLFSALILGMIGLMAGGFLFYFTELSLYWKVLSLVGLPIVFFVGTFLVMVSYPSIERDSLEKRIDHELPFAVIHMSAISGSGIEPTNIFKIIALSREYPFLRMEIRKLLNQINLYGYDLVAALNNAAHTSPSQKLSEVFTGLSTTITSGGNLQNFFEKRAETLLMGYRLEREKFSKLAETFMDIYITVVIAAPMILLLVFILLSVGDFNIGFTPSGMTWIIISIIAIVNFIFLAIIHIKQPSY